MIQRGMRRPRKKFYISKRALRPGNVIYYAMCNRCHAVSILEYDCCIV